MRPYTLSKKFSQGWISPSDLVIRVVILFNFQLPIFKEQSALLTWVLEKTVRCLCEVSPDLAVRCQLLVVSAEDLSSH